MTAIYRPNGIGQFPLIVFAHGFAGHPEKFTKLFAAWADAGFVVAAPAFPLTNSHVPEVKISDVGQQPADMSFVLDNVLALDKQRGSRLFHAIDHHRGSCQRKVITWWSYLRSLTLAYGGCRRINNGSTPSRCSTALTPDSRSTGTYRS